MCIVVLSRENIVKVSKREECVCVCGVFNTFYKTIDLASGRSQSKGWNNSKVY